jgi:hypothetical protein
VGAELIHHAGGQRRLGADHGERDLFGFCAQSRSARTSVMARSQMGLDSAVPPLPGAT